MQWAKKHLGFTIVELLIVIVVIAILALITIVAYNGVTQSAQDAVVRATVTEAAKKIEAYRFEPDNASEAYPATLGEVNIGDTGDVALEYATIAASKYFCVSGEAAGVRLYQSSLDATFREGSCPPVADLEGWWPLNGNTYDYATGSDEAISYNNPVPSEGQDGQPRSAYSFAHNAHQYIDTLHTGERDTFTASVWVLPADQGGTYRTPLSEVRDCCGSGYVGFQIVTHYGTSASRVAMWNGGSGNFGAIAAPSTLPYDTWTHIAASYDGSTIRLYEDGVEVNALNRERTVGESVDTLKIGRAGSASGGWYVGGVDDVRIYGSVLSATEVQSLYQSGAQ